MIIIIPARNEAHRIGKTLEAYLQYFTEVKAVVSLSACEDDTRGVVSAISKRYPGRVDIIESTPVSGNTKGKAVRDGWRYAVDTYADEYIGFIDADNSVTPEEFNKLVGALPGHEGAISSRYLPESYLKERDSLMRILASHFYRHFVRTLFNLPYLDTQCGGKLYTRKALIGILPKLRTNDMTFDVEVLYLLDKSGVSVVEVPIVWRENIASTISTSKKKFITTSLQMFLSLLRLRYRFWFV